MSSSCDGTDALAQTPAAPSRGPSEARRILETNDVQKVRHADGSKTINGFRVHGLLGSGSFAKVKLCEQEGSAEKFALKVFRKGRLRRQRDFVKAPDGGMKIHTSLDKVYGELKVMRGLAHPNCIRVFAIFEEAQTEGKIYLVLEYAAKGALMEWDSSALTYFVPETKGLVPEAVAKGYICDIAAGLDYLHSEQLRVAHRDIKPQNLLLHSDGRVKIADFGVAIHMAEDYTVFGTEGTYYFYSPEMCRKGYTGHDGRLADVWALGVSLFAFLFGSVPFFNKDLLYLLESIAEAKYEIPCDGPAAEACGEEGRALLARLLAPFPEGRPLSGEILEDPWLRTVAAQRLSSAPSATAAIPQVPLRSEPGLGIT